jgi:hypothetical protein
MPSTASSSSAEGERPASIAACPTVWMILPFASLLLAIALMPLMPRASHWWDNNLHKFYVAGGLGIVTLVYYLLMYRQAIVGH